MKIELFRDWPDDNRPCEETNPDLWKEFRKVKTTCESWTEAEVVQWIDWEFSKNNLLFSKEY